MTIRITLLAVVLGLVGCGPGAENDDGGNNGVDAAGTVDARPSPDADPSFFTDDDGDGFSEDQGDCNDDDIDIHPDADEVCDDLTDNNCNGAQDGNEPDGDGDGYGPCNGDCNDDDENIHPGATEIANDNIDNNCDGFIDSDFDGDGYRVVDGDCQDNNPDVNPGEIEYCFDFVDNDCNGWVDFGEPDSDGDGYGPCAGDCNDNDINISPDAAEIDGDGIDNDCDNLIDQDIDGDGWTVANGDCADNDPARNPAATEVCNDGVDQNCNGSDTDCLDDCLIADLTQSNVGCKYWAVDMDQEDSAAAACFALYVSNTHATDTANVVVERLPGGVPTALNFPGFGASRTIAPGALSVFRISGTCSAPGAAVGGDQGINKSGLQVRGAFRVTSDVPVVVYQINPFEAANTHTTDASLLIADAALDDDYYNIGYPQTNPSRGAWDLPSEINIIGVVDGTSVTVTASTSTRAGGVVPALSAGGQYTTTLNAGDNLQIATSTTGNDLTGTRIEASQRVAVFSGGECHDIPVNTGYCDHLEEQLMPTSTWGTEYVAARHPPRASENALWRFVAATNNTTITFDPAVSGNIVLNAGQSAQISTFSDFVARSTNPDRPFFVMQFMQGAERTATESGTDINTLGNLRGDPAQIISIPTEQYLDDYNFLADATYAYNWLSVVRTNSTDVIRLDCFNPIPNNRFTTIGAGPYQYARIRLSAQTGGVDGTCTAGAHSIDGDGPFGIWVYGVFADTSYGYPGGMNLQRIFTPN